jgi:limonene-1,2-epoxide hydrolase
MASPGPAGTAVRLEARADGEDQKNVAYDNHFVSVITIGDRKITHWRDYLIARVGFAQPSLLGAKSLNWWRVR